MAMYDRQVQTAKRLIKKYGASVPVTIRTVAETPGRPWETQEVITTRNEDVVFLTLDNKALATLGLSPGTEVPVGAQIAYMGAVGFEVDLQTTFLFSGKTWTIFYMDKLRPNGRVILHTMVLQS